MTSEMTDKTRIIVDMLAALLVAELVNTGVKSRNTCVKYACI